jgi:hypothetical protein
MRRVPARLRWARGPSGWSKAAGMQIVRVTRKHSGNAGRRSGVVFTWSSSRSALAEGSKPVVSVSARKDQLMVDGLRINAALPAPAMGASRGIRVVRQLEGQRRKNSWRSTANEELPSLTWIVQSTVPPLYALPYLLLLDAAGPTSLCLHRNASTNFLPSVALAAPQKCTLPCAH